MRYGTGSTSGISHRYSLVDVSAPPSGTEHRDRADEDLLSIRGTVANTPVILPPP
jgi:hypothetical protein